MTWDGFDMLNDRDFREAKEKTLEDVRSEASASYNAVLRALDDMSDEEFATRPEAQDGPAWSWIIGANTYRHYLPHREEMEAWWNRSA